MAAGTLTSYVCFERYTEENSTPPFVQTKPRGALVSVSIFAAAVKCRIMFVHFFTPAEEVVEEVSILLGGLGVAFVVL